MKMKLLLFILGLTLCASWPAFSRDLAGSSEENNEENSFLDFLDGELGEYDTFADADHDNSFDLFDLNFHLNEEGEVDTSLGEENNEEALPEEPSDEPTEETPEEPTEETPEEPAEETPEEPTEETPEEPTEETPEEPTEETPEEPTEETPEEPTEETPEEPTEETPEENTEAVVETPEENTEDTTQEEEEENNEPEDLLTQVRADAEANDVLNFGVSTIIAQGINKTKIPNDNYTVTSISNYNKTGSAKGNLYQISCVAANANGSAVLNINFTVFYQLSNQKKTLSSWSYNIKTSTPVTPTTEFAQIGQDEINTDTVQKVLNYGVAQIYAIGTQAGKISGSVLTVNNVVSVWKQATTNGFNYKFQAVLVNDKVTVNANFTVALKSSNQETKLIQWSYNVKNGTPNTNNNTTAPTNNTTNTNTTNPNNNTGTNNNGGNTSNNTTQPTNNTNNNNNGNNSTNNNTTSNNTTQPATNNTTPANNTNNDGFVELETAEIETSGEVQGALEYGTDWIIKSGNAKGKIPVSNYTITKVNSVERKTQSNGRNAYKCDVELQDAKKVITAQFTVFVKVSTQEFSLGSWTYNISNVKTSNSNGSTNTNTNTNNNTNTSNNTNTNTSTNTTTNNNTTTQPTNTTTPTNTTNSTATDFTALTQDEINSAEVQGALNFGANRVIQIGNEKGQVPVSNYTITKVNSVGKQVASNGRNAYKCDVELQDVNKVLVKAQFVVYVKVATQERSVGAWSYQVSNKGNAPKPSTNTKTL